MWSPILLGGDARYLNGDPLIVVLEWIAFFVGLFEAYALVQFFRNGKRFTNTQLSFIMAGMIVEVTLPAVYFGVEIANNMQSMTSPLEMWIKFVVLNLLWCTMPLVTFAWGVRRLARQDLAVTFRPNTLVTTTLDSAFRTVFAARSTSSGRSSVPSLQRQPDATRNSTSGRQPSHGL